MKKYILFFSFLFSISSLSETFMEKANKTTAYLSHQILKHPFIQELKQGTLPRDKFDYFEHQDRIYNKRYADALSALSAKAPTMEWMRFLREASIGVTREWSGPLPRELDQCPDCFAYSNFEIESVRRSFSEGIAAMLPCYTIYWFVSNHLNGDISENNPYRNWIQTYSNSEFGKKVEKLTYYVNQLALQLPLEEVEKMLSLYVRAVQYEWSFWNSAYVLAKWEPNNETK